MAAKTLARRAMYQKREKFILQTACIVLIYVIKLISRYVFLFNFQITSSPSIRLR